MLDHALGLAARLGRRLLRNEARFDVPRRRFAIVGVCGFIAETHMRAIRAVGGELVVGFDCVDSGLGRVEPYFPDARYFLSPGAYESYLESGRAAREVDYVCICTPDHLHAEHTIRALESGVDVICEKPLVLTPGELDELESVQRRTGRRVHPILQARHHPTVERLVRDYGSSADVHRVARVEYVSPRGSWYFDSWRGDPARSTGLMGIGIHFFDLLVLLFGAPVEFAVDAATRRRQVGHARFPHAEAHWLLSVDPEDLPHRAATRQVRSFRIDRTSFDITGQFHRLHADAFARIVQGAGLSVEDVRPTIEFCHALGERHHDRARS